MVPSLTVGILDFILATFADICGRKKTMIIGIFLCGISYVGIALLDDFFQLILCMFLIGLGSALVSGTFTAWLVSELERLKKIDIQDKVIANEVIIRNLTLVIGSIFAIFLISINPSYTFLSSGIILLLGVIPLFFITENKGSSDKIKYIDFIKKSIVEILNNKTLKKFLVSYFTFSIMLGIFLFTWQRLIIILGYSERTLGIFFLFLSVSTLLGSLLYRRSFSKDSNNNYEMIKINTGILISFLMILTNNNAVVILGLLFYEFFIGIYFSVFYILINKEIGSHNRNTILSFYSTIRFGGLSIGFFIASILFSSGIKYVWLTATGLAMISLLISLHQLSYQRKGF
jgi:predicted MFS family arabinose efflux permease